MAKDTPSMAKNKIKRSLVAVYDPPPTKKEIDGLWEYFNSCCVYCNQHIERSSRTGHLDHMLAASEGGSNSIHNFALSCAKCNGDDKREESWDTFLKRTAPSPSVYENNHKAIEHWLSLSERSSFDEAFMLKANAIVENALLKFDESVKEMRSLRDEST